MRLRNFVVILVTFAFVAHAADIKPTAPVQTAYGPVTGEDKDGLRIFRGIPYAAPPVGENRWKYPQKLASWTAPRACVEFSASAPQPMVPVYGNLEPHSEDCLYLNIWSAAKDGEKRPVMVWIHGGAFIIGAAKQKWYEGSELARNGVVVVSINYRLGPLGFLAHPALTAESPTKSSGNYGIADMAAALHWVQDNIEAFGGDKNNVMIWGESAGGAAVAALMCSPLSRGTFQKAAILSGSQIVKLRLLSSAQGRQQSMEELGLEFAKRLGVTDGADVLKEMRAKTPAELMKAARPPAKMAGEGTADHIFVDGYVITEPIRKTFAEGKQANVPLIIGDVADEGTMFAKKLAFDSVEKYRTFLNDTFHERADKIFDIYPAKDDASAFEASVGLCGDVFNRGTRTMARQTAAIQPKTFMYRFTRVSPLAEKSGMRCFHGCELPYLFGNVSDATDYADEDRQLSKQLVGYFTRFSKTGDPNGDGAPAWPAYVPAEDKHILFDSKISIGEHMRKQTLDALDELEKQ